MDNEALLAEVEDVIASIPPRDTWRLQDAEIMSWFGRVAALVEAWNPGRSIALAAAISKINAVYGREVDTGTRELLTLLHQARHDLRMKTLGPVNFAYGHGRVFDYFDDLRHIIEPATSDLFFIDPYLDAEFVTRFLPHAAEKVAIRLLSRERLDALLPAVDLFSKQTGASVSVRAAVGFHDRYVIVDKRECYHSGASFKDGARTAPTTLTQITDALKPVLQTYEGIWSQARVER